MAGTSLSFTKRVRDSLAKSEARAIIGALLTLGFIAVNVLAALGWMNSDIYIVIMQWYTPLQAVVVGFYFGTPKPISAETNESTVQQLASQVEQLTRMLAYVTKQVQQLQKQAAVKTDEK